MSKVDQFGCGRIIPKEPVRGTLELGDNCSSTIPQILPINLPMGIESELFDESQRFFNQRSNLCDPLAFRFCSDV